MNRNLNPGDKVMYRVKPGNLGIRQGVFVRYVKKRAWPPVDDKKRCMVQFRHSTTLKLVPSSKIFRDRLFETRRRRRSY